MRKEKPLFPLLLEGDVWLAVETIQYIKVKGGQLPPEKFYKRLAEWALVSTRTTTPESIEDTSPNWEEFKQPGANDFYGIAMYALSLEADSERDEAIRQLRRANKLEPRVKNSRWMTTHYGWTEVENELLEQILTDPDF